MLRHVVLIRVTDPDAHADELVARLMALPSQIPEIHEYDAGRDVSGAPNSFDVGLWSSFDDSEALERYPRTPRPPGRRGLHRGGELRSGS